MEDNFISKIPKKAFEPLLLLGRESGFDPVSSEEAELFLAKLCEQYSGRDEDIGTWLREKLGGCFKCVCKMPQWIQSPAWPFTSAGPMLFIGQIDIPPGVFHDEASFYTFFEPKTGLQKTILQVA